MASAPAFCYSCNYKYGLLDGDHRLLDTCWCGYFAADNPTIYYQKKRPRDEDKDKGESVKCEVDAWDSNVCT